MTFFIIVLLTAGICFYLGAAWQDDKHWHMQVMRDNEERADAELLSSWQRATPGLDAWRQPHLHVLHNTDADDHFDDLCRRDLVEPS